MRRLNVRYWHKADIPRLGSDVRFWGQSRHCSRAIRRGGLRRTLRKLPELVLRFMQNLNFSGSFGGRFL